VVDRESSTATTVCEVRETEDGDGDVATFAVDESDTRNENSRHA